MEKIIQKIESVVLPEEKDFGHQYRLRRALMNCSYFTEPGLGLFLSQIRFYFTSKHVVATVTIMLVMVVGISAKFVMSRSNQILLSTPVSQEIAENSLASTKPPVNAVSAPPAEPSRPSEPASSDSQVKMASDNYQQDIVSPSSIQFLTAEEMTNLLQKAFMSQDGTVMVDIDGKTYVFSFDNLANANQKSDFNITTLNTSATLTSQKEK